MKLIEILTLDVYTYVGNCVDVGDPDAYISKYFSDATELSIIDDPKQVTEITANHFFRYVPIKNIPPEALKHKNNGVSYYKVNRYNLLCLYNKTQDIHYFFEN